MRNFTGSLIPLSEIQKGEKGTLEFMHAGRGFVSRLTSLGLTPGADIEMIQNYRFGPLIINVRGTHIALSRGMARHLLIKKEDQP